MTYLQGGDDGIDDLAGAALSRALGWLDARTVQDSALRQDVLTELQTWSPESVRQILQSAEATDPYILGGLLGALRPETASIRSVAALPLSAMEGARRGNTQRLNDDVAVELGIDDTGAAPDKGFQQIWNQFWGAANLLQFLPRFALVSRAGLDQGIYQPLEATWSTPAPEPELLSDTGEIEIRWREAEAWSFQPAVVTLLRDANLPVPEVGFELQEEGGAVIGEADLAWPAQTTAAIPDDSREDAMAFEKCGWTVFVGLDESGLDQLRKQLDDGGSDEA